ncbi:IS66 family insertion sequence element accessory protein TnpA [Blastopirellula marina]|uniref:IS66 family insertion sequence element accessory protein TnpA n=1 Tax=Blastopirellula marina TaxID=124 RepID=UPI0002E8FF9B|nr:hypothetical protein [Blastopirellula marina]
MTINQSQLTRLNESARTVYGKDVVKFLCPIELEDTKDARLCNGHILNEAISDVSRKTVVQCSKIDSYFGSKIEPELIFLLALRSLPGIDLNMLFRRSGPFQVIDRNGLPVEAFFGSKKTANFQRLELHGSNGSFEIVHVREPRFDNDDKNAVVRKSTIIPDGGNRPPNPIFPPMLPWRHHRRFWGRGRIDMASSKGPRRDVAKERRWRELFSGHAKSGLSVRAFCLQRGVSEASFYAWKRELARRDDEAGGASPRFVEVMVGDGAASAEKLSMSAPLQIHLAGVRIEVPAGFDAETLKAAIAVLRAVAC